jgi:hypothetical protein
MTIAIKGVSRRGVLAGLGGMSFCMALGADGFRLIGEAQANTMANAQVTPWVRIAPTAPSPSTAPAPRWARGR